mmetsp:Transcript_10494/g.32595  ORF Transcript_10494/g.32595 Transcript_10494/m.32595 type:complete len:254 (+) Transcript_10494:79-840(+)
MAAMVGQTLVFGGRGMVGSAVCRELARRSVAPILSLGRSEGAGAGGEPAASSAVEQRSGVDALRPETFASLLPGARAVVISIGEPPWILDKERAMRSNGLTNISILRAAAEHKVPRVVLVNAAIPAWRLIAGYREGKEAAEREAHAYPEACGTDCGVTVLKPSAVSGTRYVGRTPLPLWVALEPMRFAFQTLAKPCQEMERLLPSLLGNVLRPAVRVEEIAMAAADAVEDPNPQGVRTLGPSELVGYSGQRAE